MPGLSLHATAIVIGEDGLLIRGASGAGKSSLARALLFSAGQQGRFARLIGDDRIFVEEAAGRLLARGHPAISGLIEARGVGILPETPEPACVIRLVINLADAPPPRLPEGETAVIAGLRLPLLTLGPGPDRADLTLARLCLI